MTTPFAAFDPQIANSLQGVACKLSLEYGIDRDDVVAEVAMAALDVERKYGFVHVNAVATYAAQYLYRLILTHDLDIHATYLDLDTGSARSLPITATA